VALIGGLQGPRKEFGHECIRTATKACHGLFPKRLVLEALTVIAREMGCQQVLAVCKDSHIYSSWRYRKVSRPITTASGWISVPRKSTPNTSASPSPFRASRWRKLPAKSAANTTAAMPCWTRWQKKASALMPCKKSTWLVLFF
jgi:hypothetical protein